jgi:multicomponent Na+:H+ antiporter subunit G
MNEVIAIIVVSIGLVFELIGCIGLVRMPTVYNRLQAATKCVTIGTCFVLAGVCVFAGLFSGAGLKAFICIIFVLLTSPTAAHAVARAAHRSGVPLWPGAEVDRYKDSDEGAQHLADDLDS